MFRFKKALPIIGICLFTLIPIFSVNALDLEIPVSYPISFPKFLDETDKVDIGYTDPTISLAEEPLKALENFVSERFSKDLNMMSFWIGSYRSYEESWYIVTLATTLKVQKEDKLKETDIDGTYLIILKKDQGEWFIATDEDDEFLNVLKEAPVEFISQETKDILSNQNSLMSLNNNFKFPWPNGISYYYSQGWHNANYPTLGLAYLDLGTTGSETR